MHLHCTDLFSSHCYKGRHHLKNKVLIRALPERGGGLPMPEFFGPFSLGRVRKKTEKKLTNVSLVCMYVGRKSEMSVFSVFSQQ